MVERLILWDIDGTLVRAGEIGALVFDRALEAVLGRAPGTRITMSGKTDPQIVGEYLALMAVDDPDVPRSVLAQLELELAAAAADLPAVGWPCPGAEDLLASLAQDARVSQSVLTGNIAANAAVKLKAFGLARYLDLEVGAFGSDHADRRALVPVALRRQQELRGRQLVPEDVVVVGDTPNDLACARAAGARCVLVATGRYGASDLAGLGADAVVTDLSDTAQMHDLLAPTG